ncbi:hypothetical protein E4T49_04889 [Aureobasidium sp. EXF-10728]|nr:hypothetical protein E4T49_04889 [Aureobasidium sp. EXF-10728]
MPRKHAASGDASPASQDTINVAMPQQSRPPTRLKLKVRPKEPDPEPEESSARPGRPKRKISRPARYLDNVCEPLTKKRRTTAAPAMSVLTSTPPLPTSGSPSGNSSDPILLTSSEPVDKSGYADPNEVHAGYDDDFWTNFIDDTPRSSQSALDSVIGSAKHHGSQSNFLPESNALPEAAGLVYDAFTELTSEPPTIPSKEVQDPIILSSSFSTLVQKQDSPEIIIKKLQDACHALGCLNMPPILPQRHISSSTTEPKASSELDTDLPDTDTNEDDGVDALLAAAAGCDQSEANQEKDLNGAHFGEPDGEVSLLINKAIEILRHHISSIRGLAAIQVSQSGKGKHSRTNHWNTDTEQLVLSTLEPLLYGGATNIGCLIPSERANLLWQLYSCLVHLVTAPHIALSRTVGLLQQETKGENSQGRAIAPKKKRSPGQSHKARAAKVPVPHKFLSRQKNPTPTRIHRDGHAHPSRRAHNQAPNGYQMPYNNHTHPQPHTTFFGYPPPLFPAGHGMVLPPGPRPHTNNQLDLAVFSQPGLSHYPTRMMPMVVNPGFQPYQWTMRPSFPPDSWTPVPNFGLPSVQNSMRNPFWL